MCGLFGFVTKSKHGFTHTEREIIEYLCYLDTLRGVDATGLLHVMKDGESELLKEASAGYNFINRKEVSNALGRSISKGRAVLGHNRKATVGGYADAQAHPFEVKNRFVFFHNGRLYNHEKVAKTEVDSEALGILLCGATKEEIQTALSDHTVAMACVWYDREEHKVYFLRNYERPLHYVFLADGGFIYASEKWMLEAIEEILKLKYKGPPVSFTVETLYSMDLGADVLQLTEEVLKIPAKKVQPLYTGGTYLGTKTTSVSNKSKKSDLIAGQEEVLSRNRYKRESRQFLAGDLIVAWVDDVLPVAGEADDWVIYASHENYPGWAFTCTITGQTKLWMEEEVEGHLLYGKVNHTMYEKDALMGLAELKTDGLKFSKKARETMKDRVCH